MIQLDMRFLGEFVVKIAGVAVTALNKPRLQSLFAFLVLHSDAPQQRSRLAGMLWPDRSESQALANLRNLVFTLRRALPDGDVLIRASSQTVQWNPDIPFTLDVLEFQRVAGLEAPHSLALERLEAAAALYKGDLLPGCDEDWVIAEREQYQRQSHLLLDELTSHYEGLRRYADAVTTCQRLVSADPFHPNGFPRLMRLFALQGDAPAALKTYQTYARLLKRELKIEPPAEMQELHHRLMARRERVRPGAAALPPAENLPPHVPLLPLVGRDAEWQAIQRVWKTSAAGSAQLLLIRGEAGMGKTRLAEELAGWAARQGIRVAVAHCYASEGALPYAPVVEWLRNLRLPPLDRVWLTELSRLLPELHGQKKRRPAPLTEAWQRLRLFEALARALWGEHQVKGPQLKTMLLIEDLHWCDQDSMEWLHYLLRYDPSAPLLVVATVRSEEMETNLAYQKLRFGVQQQGKLVEVELDPLSEGETGQLAAHAAGKSLKRGLSALIYQETEGHPLMIVETVQAELYPHGSSPCVQSLPYKSHAVMENRIRQLSPQARELCLLAATVGRAFSLEVLRQANLFEETVLVQSLEEMLQKRIAREVARSTFDFSHDKLRQAAFATVSTARRQLLHRQVADALVRLTENDPAGKSGEIASHYDEAGSGTQAIHYYQLAAESAREIYANELAMQYYQRAIDLAEDVRPPLPTVEMSQLYEKLGEMFMTVGKFPEALSAFERALARPDRSRSLWMAQLYRKIAWAQMQQYQHAQAMETLDRAEQALGLPPEWHRGVGDKNETLPVRSSKTRLRTPTADGAMLEQQEWIQIQIDRSNFFYWNNRPDEIEAIVKTIDSLVDAYGRPDQRTALLEQQLWARFRRERYRFSAETVEVARRKLELIVPLNVPYDIAWAEFGYGFSLLWHDQPVEAREWMLKAYDTAVKIGASLMQVRLLAYLGVTSRLLGDLQSLREESSLLLPLAAQIKEYAYLGICQANLGWLAWKEGDLEAAERQCATAYETWNQSGGQVFHWLADWVMLAMAVARRDLERAEAVTKVLLDPDPLSQPVRESIARQLEQALRVYQSQDTAGAFGCFEQALEMVKSCREL